jgi:methylenetetrahydrofolate dehydrogenase (NADP+)/methenyltetrahydrofolate cyclohydrolase
MTARILDGAALAEQIQAEVAERTAHLTRRGTVPALSVILVGNDPASEIYVRAKGRACAAAGMRSETIALSADTREADLLAVIDRLNADRRVHGILCQMPVPPHIDADKVLRRIDPRKDVDGFHPMNVGKLVLGDPTAFIPATPFGVREMLRRYDIPTRGAHAVVVGRSTIVGRPMANLLAQPGPEGDATVTLCHSRTRDVTAICQTADLLIVAIGRPEFIRGDAIKPGATVIDVGVNRVPDSTQSRGYRVVGDVAFDEAREVAGAITPVPGGVGRMTIAMVLSNTLKAAELHLGDA